MQFRDSMMLMIACKKQNESTTSMVMGTIQMLGHWMETFTTVMKVGMPLGVTPHNLDSGTLRYH